MGKVKVKRVSRVDIRANDAADGDIRRERTRERLAGAVLSLASERDISTASISELTRRAGIYRTTFYSHAETPMDLLIKVLSSELDLVRQEGIAELENDGQLFHDLSHRLLGEVVDHVVKHEAIYAGMDCASSIFALRTVLAEHIEASIALFLREGFLAPPSSRAEDAAIYSGFLAHGIAGAIEAWLRLPAPRDRKQLLTAIEATYPSWYAPEPGPRNVEARSARRAAPLSEPQKLKRRTP